jgi:hypothetical protein
MPVCLGVRYVVEQRQLDARICGAGWSRRAVLLAGLAVAGCGHERRPTIEGVAEETSGEPTGNDLQQILDRRAKAVQNSDERTFLADLDQSNETLVQHQKMLFANLRQLKFGNFSYVAERIAGSREQSGAYRFSPVIQVAQLTTDAGPGGVAPAETFQYLLVRKDNKLVVTEIVAATRSNAEKLRITGPLADAPWNTTPLKVLQAGDVWLAGDDSVPDLDRYAAAAQAEAHKVEALWGQRIRFPGYILFFTKNNANFRTWFSFGAASNFSADVEGVQVPLRGVRKTGQEYAGQYAGSRVVVNLRSTAIGGDDPQVVMRHELAHAVTARAMAVSMGGFIGVLGAPAWAVEGFARWVETLEYPNRKSQVHAIVASGVAAGRFHGKPPLSKTFYGPDAGFNYDVGASVFTFIEQTKGRDAAVEFYASVVQYNDTEETAVADAPVFNAICKRVLGVPGATFLQRWSGFVRGGV